jgi:hypothetical protein
MPTVLRQDGFRFFFYSNENDEPAHVHVEKGDAEGKIWLMPKTEIAYLNGFSSSEVKQIAVIVFEFSEQFKTKWNGHFKK